MDMSVVRETVKRIERVAPFGTAALISETKFSAGSPFEDLRGGAINAGFQCVGVGAYAFVLEVPEHPDMVLKVVPHLYDPYRAFVDFVVSTKHTLPPEQAAFLPVIHHVEETPAGVMLVFMERLETVSHDDWHDDPYMRHLRQTLDHGEEHDGGYCRHAMAVHELLLEHKPNGAWMDIHKSNAMLRSDGQLVVTDPYAGNDQSEDWECSVSAKSSHWTDGSDDTRSDR